MTEPFYRPCWVEINTAALRQNFRLLKKILPSSVQVLSVVKANAYGHGLVPVSKIVVEEGAAYLGVSSLEEGVTLRNAGVRVPILILGSLYPFDNFPVLFEHQLTPTVASVEAAEALNQLAQKRGQRLPVHLKIDSGFGRIGVSPAFARAFIAQVAHYSGLQLEGLYTHFASSDVDPSYTQEQAQAFGAVVKEIQAQGIRPPLVHMANSSAVLRFPETHGTMARLGLALYGIPPYVGAERPHALTPILSWKTRIIFLKIVSSGSTISYARTWVASRPTRVATLAVGYADGFPRLLSNRGEVLVHGQRVPILGRVTMDMVMVDVTEVPECHVGDEVVLLGAQDKERVTAQDLAEQVQTNPYEILCRIADRVPRIYL